ncbi:MAG: hypothetical protein WBA63_07185 [Thermomicrobiales bacterium]
MNNTQTSLRFYIDQADDKAVIRAVPVKPVVVRNTHRITVAEAPGEAITVAETKPDRQLPVIQRPQIARSASERVSRLVRRHSAKKS